MCERQVNAPGCEPLFESVKGVCVCVYVRE